MITKIVYISFRDTYRDIHEMYFARIRSSTLLIQGFRDKARFRWNPEIIRVIWRGRRDWIAGRLISRITAKI